jgi:hypothetical protein
LKLMEWLQVILLHIIIERIFNICHLL